jgi:cold shock CspA family protein
MSKLGRVTEWNDERGYGFLVPKDGGPRVFVHMQEFSAIGATARTWRVAALCRR